MDGLFKDFLLSGEIPSLNSLLLLDVSFSSVVLFFPFSEDGVTLLDDLDGIIRLLLEDLGDINLSLHFVTNLIGNGLKDVFKLKVILVNVSGNGPNEFQTGQK
jgi:hypothetical protein